MSKTIEIDVWVQDLILSNKYEYEAFVRGESTQVKRKPSEGYLKAKLIIEIPERKIEITESQFDEAVKNAMDRAILSHKEFVYYPKTMTKYIKENLGLI